MFASMALGPAPPALISARQWLSVLRSGGSKKTRFANVALVTVLPTIMPAMKVIGGLYIAYLAVQIFRIKSSKQVANHSLTSTFMAGFLMQFINPKVVLFTLTVIPSFVLPYYTSSLMLAMYVLCITLIGFLAFITWILFGSIFKDFLQKHQKATNIVMALFLLYSAVMVSGVL